MPATLVLVIVIFAYRDIPKDDEARLKNAFEQGKICAQAAVDENIELMLDTLNPIAVKSAGGRDKMRKIMTDNISQVKSGGWAVTEVKVEPAQSLHRSASSLYCVLPETILTVGLKGKFTIRSYLIGASTDNGQTWTFIDGDPGETAIRKFFPDIPEDLEFPAKQAPVRERATAEKPKK